MVPLAVIPVGAASGAVGMALALLEYGESV
jgi:hypothetical protein